MDLMSAMKRIRWKEGGQCKYASVDRTLIEVKITAVRLGLHTRPSKQVPVCQSVALVPHVNTLPLLPHGPRPSLAVQW